MAMSLELFDVFFRTGTFFETGLVLGELARTPGICIIVLPREIEGVFDCADCLH